MNKNTPGKFNDRQYMTLKDYEVFYYNDLELNSVPLHNHDFYEIYLFLEGSIDYTVDSTTYNLNPGDILLIPPKVKHRAIIKDSSKPYRRYVLWLNEGFYKSLGDTDPDILYIFDIAKHSGSYKLNIPENLLQSVQTPFVTLLEESLNPKFCHNILSKTLAITLLVSINRVIHTVNNSEPKVDIKEDLYLKICNYIHNNLSADLSLDALANNFFVSKYYICHIFKDHLGISVHQYIIRKRLDISREKLLSGTPISALPAACGFNDYSSFYRSFKKEYGLSPKDFKDKNNGTKVMKKDIEKS